MSLEIFFHKKKRELQKELENNKDINDSDLGIKRRVVVEGGKCKSRQQSSGLFIWFLLEISV
jgi:hypothetical protein